MAKPKIESRGADRTQPKRVYQCSGCDATFKLHPGRHWHKCGGYEWNMYEENTVRAVKAALPGLAGLVDLAKRVKP